MELHPLEAELIRRIRSRYRFGRVIIITHEGLPRKIEEVTTFDDLRDSYPQGKGDITPTNGV